MEIFDDLEAEYARLDAILEGLDPGAWSCPSAAPGWSVADVVLHLAQTEEMVVATMTGASYPGGEIGAGRTTDELVENWVRSERGDTVGVLDRWRAARQTSVAALRAADPDVAVVWIAAPLKPSTLATTRLAEHWAHGLDITEPLGIPFPDTRRLRHIAWLGHATLPYAFGLAGQTPHAVHCALTGPDDDVWRFGPADADSTVTGTAGEFCRVGAQRLRPEDSGLVAHGPHAAAALRVLRNYAG